MIICYTVSLDMAYNGFNYFSFWAIFCPLTPLPAPTPLNSPKNQNFEKMKKKKKSLEISSFYICVPKIMFRWCTVPEIWCMTDDGRTDKRKKWHIEVGAPPKNCNRVHRRYVVDTCNRVWSIILLPLMTRTSFVLVMLTRLIVSKPKEWATWPHRTDMNFPFLRGRRIQYFSVSA